MYRSTGSRNPQGPLYPGAPGQEACSEIARGKAGRLQG